MQGVLDKQKTLLLIESVIAPFVGETMARASTQVHCEKLGIVGAEMTPQDLEALLDRLAKAMSVFVGKEKSKKLIAEIDTTIRTGGEPR